MNDKITRYIDTKGYLSEVEKLIAEGKQVVIPVSGGSMTPFLVGERDFVMLEKTELAEIRRGDILLYRRENGQFVLHRVYAMQEKTRTKQFYMMGDVQTVVEGPIYERQIIARVSNIKRKGVWKKKKNFWEFFFRRIWIKIPHMRPYAMRMYGRFRRTAVQSGNSTTWNKEKRQHTGD